MTLYLVAYDLNSPGQDYDGLIEHLKSYDLWWHYLDSTWIVRSDTSTTGVRDAARRYIDSGDELLVVDITGDSAAWVGFSDRASNWLKRNL